MGLKVAVSGKGGAGKTTLAALFAHLAAFEGRSVLAIDADPAANLAACLGMSEEDRRKIIPLSLQRALIEERTGAKVGQYGQIFKVNPSVSDIAEKESAAFRSIHLLVLGAIERGGSGCACPESAILRSLLADVILFKDDLVILDMEAGLEHLGRATARGVDLLLVVAEAGARSVETAEAILRLAAEIGIPRLAVVGNKVATPEEDDFLRRSFQGRDYLGCIPFDETVRRADRENLVLVDVAPPGLLARFRGIWEAVKSRASR